MACSFSCSCNLHGSFVLLRVSILRSPIAEKQKWPKGDNMRDGTNNLIVRAEEYMKEHKFGEAGKCFEEAAA